MIRLKRIIAIIFLALIAGVTAFLIWAETPLGPMPEALAALESDDRVIVDVGKWITFEPSGESPSTGFIIYPGGRVDPRSYAPTAREIAKQGYLVVIVDMPLNLAVVGADRANLVIDSYPEIGVWAIGGHSLGGSMAANFAADPSTGIRGLVLWASYPPSNADLSKLPIAVASMIGSEDGLLSVNEVNSSAILLPPDTKWIIIEGGNHAQFGWYGDQRGDNPALISREEQQLRAIQETVELLKGLQD